MVIVTPDEAFLSFDAKRKFGWPNGYGLAVYGYSRYGDNNPLAGVYQTYHGKDGLITVRKKFYWPSNPSSSLVDARRAVFADGVAAWQALTSLQKKSYDDLTSPSNMSGYNRFLRLYLKSH